jgi:hypothetical protein
MEVKTIVLCESATRHPDQTFSLLRGGIDVWHVAQFPAAIRFSFVIILEWLSTETGRNRTIELDVIDMDGNRQMDTIRIGGEVPVKPNARRYKANLIGSLGFNAVKSGVYSLHVGMDGRNVSTFEFSVLQTQKQSAA